MTLRPFLTSGSLVLMAALQIGCATFPPTSSAPDSVYEKTGTVPSVRGAANASKPVRNERPGLGTGWGERRDSQVEPTYFVRSSRTRPLSVSKTFYNDENGAKAMLVGRVFHKARGSITIGSGLIGLALQDASGNNLPSYQSGDDRIFVGKPGKRYTIVAENLTSSRLELVISVDGLDVLDGEPASFSKRGYVIEPGEKLRVAGFRESENKVAAFRFSSVRNSYAQQRHGEARNVGVIGAAVFHEKGTRPKKWSHSERRRRMDADPFPQKSRFATPPPAND